MGTYWSGSFPNGANREVKQELLLSILVDGREARRSRLEWLLNGKMGNQWTRQTWGCRLRRWVVSVLMVGNWVEGEEG